MPSSAVPDRSLGMSTDHKPEPDQITATRHRELAIEHLLFQTIRELAREKPVLLDQLDASLDHLWDNGPKESHDDEAVRTIARSFFRSLRS